MALCSDAAMVLFYSIAGDNADHDDWHTYEHMHERLSIPGFVRATRWVAPGPVHEGAAAPRYMVIYETTGTDIGTSAPYLERLNNPTGWTTAMMPRFRGMVRGFATVVAGAGYGNGNAAVALRFTPAEGQGAALKAWLAQDALPAMASRRGMAGVHLLQPAPPPPMTREQSIRGADTPLSWLVLATGNDAQALGAAVAAHMGPAQMEQHGALPGAVQAHYTLHYTATAQEVGRTPPHPVLTEPMRHAAALPRL